MAPLPQGLGREQADRIAVLSLNKWFAALVITDKKERSQVYYVCEHHIHCVFTDCEARNSIREQ